MPDLSPAQADTVVELIENYAEGAVTAHTDAGAIFVAGDQRLLIDAEGVVTEFQGLLPVAKVEESFPVVSFREARMHLRRPFTTNAVRFKVLRSWSGGGEIATYIDARLVEERLNLVVAGKWSDDYEPISGGNAMWCHLTVDGVTRSDIGEHAMWKARRSDALKRAAVSFGVGVSLYAIPAGKIDGQFLETFKTKKGKDGARLTAHGVRHLRERYAAWLERVGAEQFGEALDHGDVEDSAGDVEAEVPATAVVAASDEPEALTDPAALALVEKAQRLHQVVPATAMPKAAFNRALESAKSSLPDLEKLVGQLEGMQS